MHTPATLLCSCIVAATSTCQPKQKRCPPPSWVWFPLLESSHPSLPWAVQMLEADRNTILRRCSVLAQDLRIVDPKLSYPSTILGRDRAIVLNLQPMKVDALPGLWLMALTSEPCTVLFRAIPAMLWYTNVLSSTVVQYCSRWPAGAVPRLACARCSICSVHRWTVCACPFVACSA